MLNTETRKDFFISYTKEDLLWAEWVTWQLEEEGYSTIFHGWDSGPSSNFIQEMDNAMQAAERTIALLSPSYLKAHFTQIEWQSAFRQDPKGERRLLLLLRIQACQPEGILAAIGYIDLVGLDESVARQRLLIGAQRGRHKPSKRPNFPGNY